MLVLLSLLLGTVCGLPIGAMIMHIYDDEKFNKYRKFMGISCVNKCLWDT